MSYDQLQQKGKRRPRLQLLFLSTQTSVKFFNKPASHNLRRDEQRIMIVINHVQNFKPLSQRAFLKLRNEVERKHPLRFNKTFLQLLASNNQHLIQNNNQNVPEI